MKTIEIYEKVATEHGFIVTTICDEDVIVRNNKYVRVVNGLVKAYQSLEKIVSGEEPFTRMSIVEGALVCDSCLDEDELEVLRQIVRSIRKIEMFVREQVGFEELDEEVDELITQILEAIDEFCE